MDDTTRLITTLILLIVLILTAVVTPIARRRRELFPLRSIPAYEALPLMAGEAVESDRALHVSFGGAGIGGGRTALALASADVFYQAARRASVGAQSPIVTVGDASAVPLAYSALYAAYRSQARADRARYAGVQWIPAQSGRSLVLAAALTGLAHTERPSGHILVGTYGAEIALVLDAAARRGATTIATSDDLVGQAAAFVMSTTPLIGEEVFVASAYLDTEGTRGNALGGVIALDILRVGLIAAIIIGVVVVLLNSGSLTLTPGGG